MVDQGRVGFIEPDRCADLSALDDFKQWHSGLLGFTDSGDLLPGNHVLCGARNLMRPRQIQRARNLETPAHFEHGDDVAEGDAFEQPQPR